MNEHEWFLYVILYFDFFTLQNLEMVQEAPGKCPRGMKLKAYGAQEPRHKPKYVEVTSTAVIRPHGIYQAFYNNMIFSALKLSILVVSISTLIIAVVGTAFGFLLARRRFYGKELLDAVLTLPMVLPPTVTGYYLILLLGRRGLLGAPLYDLTGWSVTFTWVAAVVASTVVAVPLMVKSARAAIESVNHDYENVSRIMGKGEWETFFRVTLPLAKKGILAGVILSFARAFGEFGATMMLAGNISGKTQTMPLAIYEAMAAGEDAVAAWLAVILTGISLMVVYLTNRLSRPAERN